MIALVVFIGAGCTGQQTTTPTQTDLNQQEAPQDISPELSVQPTIEPGIYVQFVTNVHDWVFPEESVETLNRLIDLHESFNIPVEMHLTDTVTQKYVEMAPELMNRLATSKMVSVSYHVRPPHPMYTGFDTVGLDTMNEAERYETLMAYETHKLNLQTGGYTDEPGGYAFLADQLGYAPPIVGMTNGKYGETYSRVLKDLGARFTVLHERGPSLITDTLHGLYKRPEDQEVKLYEFKVPERFDPDAEFEEWTKGFDGSKDWFVNLKYHENNFYLSGTPHAAIYWTDWDDGRSIPRESPWDISVAYDHLELRTDKLQDGHWALYEEALQYLSDHQDTLTAINATDLVKMLEK